MFVSLSLEKIGNQKLGFQPAWVDLVKGIYSKGLTKERLAGYTDYSNANSVGSRGVFINYLLQEGNIYHVSQPRNWKHHDIYFCIVRDGEIIKLEFKKVIEILTNRKYNHHVIIDRETGEIVA
jgi:hypothetical protein